MIGTMTMFYIACDICGDQVDGEFIAWTDEDSAKLEAGESEWNLKDGKHYCPQHWICEASQCHVELGPLAGEQDYLCEKHQQ